MSTVTNIEWTDVSWNPVRGCSLVSAGCAHCYAMKQAHRFSGSGKPYEGLTELGPQGPRWTGKITLVPELLDEPLRWQKPRRVFVNSMSDLFHEGIPFDFIEQVFVTMAQSPRHTFQILTKRPERMLDFLMVNSTGGRIFHLADDRGVESGEWPLPNVWLGVSVEDQQTADERIPLLCEAPAAVRFISAEPLLGPIDLERIDGGILGRDFKGLHLAVLTGGRESPTPWHLNWVIVGGESGPGARPCDVAWIRSIVRQCRAAGVPVFVKQLGSRGKVIMPERPTSEDGRKWYADVRALRAQTDRKGGTFSSFPEDLRVREWPR